MGDSAEKHLSTLDRFLLVTLVPLWLACVALSVHSALLGVAYPPIYVTAPVDPSDHPVVSAFRPFLADEDSELEIGDRILSVGAVDLSGAGPLRFFVTFVAEARRDRPVRLVAERGEHRLVVRIAAQSHAAFIWPLLPASILCALTGVALLLRAPTSPMVCGVFRALVCAGIYLASQFGGEPSITYASIVVFALATALNGPLSLRALQLFPHGVEPRGFWPTLGPWLFVAMAPLALSARYGFPLAPDLGVKPSALAVALFGTMLAIAARNYRSSDRIDRRRIKWVVLGLFLALVPPMVSTALAVAVDARVTAAYFLSLSAIGLIPLCLLVAVARYNLFDVDRLISAAASYNLLIGACVAAGLLLGPVIASTLADFLGIAPGASRVVVSLALATAVVPAHRKLRPQIERVFFRQRYEVDRGVAELLATVGGCADASTLTECIGRGLDRIFAPDACVVYARIDESFSPVFVRGRAVPPVFSATGPLVGTLSGRTSPLALSAAGRRPDDARLGPFERAALETLDADVVVPVHGRRFLAAFICLGSRQSGDVYTSTDVSQLGTVAAATSARLVEFDQEQVIREARVMQSSLRRYVPDAIARELANGSPLRAEERAVSVMFVDIRGFSTLAEGKTPDEIFSALSRYTAAVSDQIRRHGGSVVEFNGDGMMAVFGAPRALEQKERAAVEAGWAISENMGEIAFADPTGEWKLSVGVGIATGPAFVGNIEAVDRAIWSAVGNTTNLAARLQVMTRDLGVAMVIDDKTWLALGALRGAFERHEDVAIRGRSGRFSLYTWRPVGMPT